MTEDIDMKYNELYTTTSETEKEKELSIDIISSHIQLLKKYVSIGERRFVLRVLRGIRSIRKELSTSLLKKSIETFMSQCSEDVAHSFIVSALSGMNIDSSEMVIDQSHDKIISSDDTTRLQPVLTLYFGLLTLLLSLNHRQYEHAQNISLFFVEYIQKINMRLLDPIAASIYFYYFCSYEIANNNTSLIRPILLQSYQSRCLRDDFMSQAVLLNSIVRSYIRDHLYDQADMLTSKVTFPEHADNQQVARYMYYLGRIKAIQLEYSTAYQYLLQAIRKSPPLGSINSLGFHQSVHKLAIIIQLLTGEIPDRALFRQSVLRKSLNAYFHLTKAIRKGDLNMFNQVQQRYASIFHKDDNFTLIMRLRHNVIKTGVRLISKAYSRISFRDICSKLNLESAQDAEFIVAKTIRDGVIDAIVDHDDHVMKSKELIKVYDTSEPQNNYYSRTCFCIDLHEEAVQAMRYSDHMKKDWKSSRYQHLDFKDMDAVTNDIDDADFI